MMLNKLTGDKMGISEIEFGRVLARLDAQDEEIKALRSDVKSLLAIANQGRGGIMILCTLGSVFGAIFGWLSSKLIHLL